MEKRIKLSEKQLSAITKIEELKKTLSEQYRREEEKESLILELIMESNEITETPSSVALENGFVVFSFKEKEEKKVKTRKK